MKIKSLQKLAASRNISTNRDFFTSMDFDTMHTMYLAVKPRLLLKKVDFSNRRRLKVS